MIGQRNHRATDLNRLLKSTLAIVLAGGRGTRLQHLTENQSKPAMPFGGTFRIIDFSLSNCINSGERRARKGSVTFADGRIYYRTERGTMILIEPNREEYIERGRFDQPDRTRSPAWTYPVVANGKLYVRDQDLLLCYNVKAK